MKYFYIQNHLSKPEAFDLPLVADVATLDDGTIVGGNFIGATYDDYMAGAWIPLDEKQMAFYGANPQASWKEVIEMQLTPPPPEPPLSELKKQAVEQVKQASVGKLNEMFPQLDINLAVLGLADETSAMTLFSSYDTAADAVKAVLYKALGDIGDSGNRGGVEEAVRVFNLSLAGI